MVSSCCERRDELEGERVLGAILDAVEADEALALAKLGVRIGGALAVFQAEVAIDAFARVALDAPERDGGDGAEESAQRADHAAEKARDDDIHADEQEEHEPDDPRADVEVLPDVNGGGEDEIERRQDGRGHRAMEEADGIEQADLEAAEERGDNHRR